MINFLYVDNSNIWIEGQRLSAVVNGLAPSMDVAFDEGILDSEWRYDFGKLYGLLAEPGEAIGRSMLVGSRPPSSDSLWELARSNGFEVEVFDRNVRNKEKQVDTSLTTTMVGDVHRFMASRAPEARMVLASGDADFIPPLMEARSLDIQTRVVCWEHSVSRELRDLADEFVPLDFRLADLTIRNG